MKFLFVSVVLKKTKYMMGASTKFQTMKVRVAATSAGNLKNSERQGNRGSPGNREQMTELKQRNVRMHHDQIV